GNIDAVRDCVRALNCAPRFSLNRPAEFLFVRMPANSGRIEEDARASHRSKPCAFGVPLIPTDKRSDSADRCVKSSKAEITRREVEFLVVRRIIRYVHLAIDPGNLAGRIHDGSAVVIETRCSPFKDGRDHGDAFLTRYSTNGFGRWAGHRLSQVEERCIFALAKIL